MRLELQQFFFPCFYTKHNRWMHCQWECEGGWTTVVGSTYWNRSHGFANDSKWWSCTFAAGGVCGHQKIINAKCFWKSNFLLYGEWWHKHLWWLQWRFGVDLIMVLAVHLIIVCSIVYWIAYTMFNKCGCTLEQSMMELIYHWTWKLNHA